MIYWPFYKLEVMFIYCTRITNRLFTQAKTTINPSRSRLVYFFLLVSLFQPHSALPTLDCVYSSMPASPASEQLPRYTTYPPRFDMPSNVMERLRNSTRPNSLVLALLFITLFEFVCTVSVMWYIQKNVVEPLARTHQT